MIKNKCFVCGGYDFRADRALSGRLICMTCGNPYGVRKVTRKKSINISYSLIDSKRVIFISLLILVVILIVI